MTKIYESSRVLHQKGAVKMIQSPQQNDIGHHQSATQWNKAAKEIPRDAIFVGNLSYFCSESILTSLFSQYGAVLSVSIQRSRKNLPLHYGFIDMAPADAEKAIQGLNNLVFMGRKMR